MDAVLVAETPHHHQGRTSLTTLASVVQSPDVNAEVVNESPDKQAVMESPSVHSESRQLLAEEPALLSQTQPGI